MGIGWRATKLGQVAKLTMGQSPPSSLCNEDGDGLPFFQGNAEFGHRHPVPSKWIEQEFKVAEPGDILISVRAPVGELNVAAERCVIGRGLAAIRGTKLDREYTYYLMHERKRRLEALGQGSTFDAINSSDLRDLRVALPPLPEQKKIAAILASVDEAIQATQAVIEQTRRVKEGLLQDLLTRGIGHTRLKQTEIGELPESWDVVNVDDVADPDRQTILTGPFGASLSNEDFIESGVPVLRIGNVRWGYLDTDNMLYVSEQKAQELEKYRVRRGDLLFARQGATTGRNAMASGEVDGWLINYHIIRVAVDHSKCLPEYLAYYFNSPYLQRQVDGEKGRGTREGVNSSTIRGFRFALPPVGQQQEICATLEAVDSSVYASEAQVASLQQVKAGLLQDLLTGNVRVSV